MASRYNHDNPPNAAKKQRRDQFVYFCATHIDKWRRGHSGIACCEHWKFKRYWWREHHKGLSHFIWTVCTHKAWKEMRIQLGLPVEYE